MFNEPFIGTNEIEDKIENKIENETNLKIETDKINKISEDYMLNGNYIMKKIKENESNILLDKIKERENQLSISINDIKYESDCSQYQLYKGGRSNRRCRFCGSRNYCYIFNNGCGTASIFICGDCIDKNKRSCKKKLKHNYFLNHWDNNTHAICLPHSTIDVKKYGKTLKIIIESHKERIQIPITFFTYKLLYLQCFDEMIEDIYVYIVDIFIKLLDINFVDKVFDLKKLIY